MGEFIEGWKDEEAYREDYLIYKESEPGDELNDHVPQSCRYQSISPQ